MKQSSTSPFVLHVIFLNENGTGEVHMDLSSAVPPTWQHPVAGAGILLNIILIITRRKRAKPACRGEEDRSPPRFGILSLCLSFFLLKNKHIESKSFMQNRKSKDLADGSQAGCTVRAER